MNNLEITFLQANEFEKRSGFLWYTDQHAYLKSMSESLNKPLELVCGVMAVISPSIPWGFNLNMGYHILKHRTVIGFKTMGYKKNINKALKMVRHKRVWPYLSGPKVEEFYYNLLNPFDDQHITVDTFILSCYFQITDKSQINKYARPKYIDEVKQAIRLLADKYDLLPCQFQAIVWLTYHRLVKSMLSYSGQLQLKVF